MTETMTIETYQDLPSAQEPGYMTGAPVEGTRFYVQENGCTYTRTRTEDGWYWKEERPSEVPERAKEA